MYERDGRTNGRTDTAWRQRPRGNEYKPMEFFHVIFIKPFIIVTPRTRTAEMHKHNKLEAVTCHGMMQLLRFRTTPSSNSTCMLVSYIYQVSCLHLQLLQRYRDSEILLTRRNKLGLQTPAKILASRNQWLIRWSTLATLQDVQEPFFGLLTGTDKLIHAVKHSRPCSRYCPYNKLKLHTPCDTGNCLQFKKIYFILSYLQLF